METATHILAYLWTGIGFVMLIISVVSPLVAWEEWRVNLAERAGLMSNEPTESEVILSDSAIFLSYRMFLNSVIYIPMNLVITSAGLIAILIPPATQSGELRAVIISSLLIGVEAIMATSQILMFIILMGIRGYRKRWYEFMRQRRERRDVQGTME